MTIRKLAGVLTKFKTSLVTLSWDFYLLPVTPAGVLVSDETPPFLSLTGQPLDGAPVVVHLRLSLLPLIQVSDESGRPSHAVVVDVFLAVP